MRGKIICLILAIAVIFGGALLFFERKANQEPAKTPGMEITVRMEREKIIKLLEEKTSLPRLELISRVIPEKVEISCRAEFTGDGQKPVTFSEFSINGKKIPRELYENYLDFTCSLVYN